MSSMQIVGMRNVPEEILAEWRKKSGGMLGSSASPPEANPLANAIAASAAAMALPEMVDPTAVGGGDLTSMLGALPQLQSVEVPEPPEPPPAGPEGQDWASQVQQWMQAKKEEEEKAPPPLPALPPFPMLGKPQFTPPPGGMPPPLVPDSDMPMPSLSNQVQQWMSSQKQPDAPEADLPLASQVQQWMASRNQQEEMDAPNDFDSGDGFPAPSSSASADPPVQQVAEPEPVDLQTRIRQFGFQPSQVVPLAERAQEQMKSTAAQLLARGLGNLERSSQASNASRLEMENTKLKQQLADAERRASEAAAAASRANASGTSAAAQSGTAPGAAQDTVAVVQRSRSRSRGRRSPPGSNNNRGREMRSSAGDSAPTYESRTIQITGGVVGTRLWLKQEMSRFGRVEVCHTGNRQNPEAEPPWVRFEKMSSVETALNAIAAGQVLFDGMPIKAELKASRSHAPPRPTRERSPKRRDLEVTSRDLARESHRPGRRDWDMDDYNKGQQGPGNYSSRDLFRAEMRRGRDRRGRSSSDSGPRRRRR